MARNAPPSRALCRNFTEILESHPETCGCLSCRRIDGSDEPPEVVDPGIDYESFADRLLDLSPEEYLAPPLAKLPTIIPPGQREEVYRQRFHAHEAIFHPDDISQAEAVARAASRGPNGAVVLGEFIAETQDYTHDEEEIGKLIYDQADQVRIDWLNERLPPGWAPVESWPRESADQALARSA